MRLVPAQTLKRVREIRKFENSAINSTHKKAKREEEMVREGTVKILTVCKLLDESIPNFSC